MSLLFEVTELDFKLNVENSSFLDETWTIPVSESVHVDRQDVSSATVRCVSTLSSCHMLFHHLCGTAHVTHSSPPTHPHTFLPTLLPTHTPPSHTHLRYIFQCHYRPLKLWI